MNKKMRFLPLALVSLLAAQSSPIRGATLFGALGAVGTAWYKGVTCKALSPIENDICKVSLGVATVAVVMMPMISALRKLIKLHRDMKTAIQDHNQELVEQIATLIARESLGRYTWCALFNRNHEALKFMLERGANPHTPHMISAFFLEIPLNAALARDDFESAHLLLDYGANPAQFNTKGIAPIHYAYKDEALAQKMRQKMEESAKKDMERLEILYCKQPPKPSRIRERFARMRAHISQRLAAVFRRKKEEAV